MQSRIGQPLRPPTWIDSWAALHEKSFGLGRVHLGLTFVRMDVEHLDRHRDRHRRLAVHTRGHLALWRRESSAHQQPLRVHPTLLRLYEEAESSPGHQISGRTGTRHSGVKRAGFSSLRTPVCGLKGGRMEPGRICFSGQKRHCHFQSRT
jgi:hypothetical protein